VTDAHLKGILMRIGPITSGMPSTLLIAAAAFLVADARVTFLYSDVLQRNDLVVNGDNPFNCPDGCTVYLDHNTENMYISTEDGDEIANFNNTIDDPTLPLEGIDLPAGTNYKLYRKDNTREDFVFYAVSVNAPNYGSPVFAARPDDEVVASIEGHYATFLSSSMALNFFELKGDFPGSGDVEVYSTGFDAVADDVYRTTPCSPVYTSRSQHNAEGAMLTVISPIATVYFNVNGNYSISVKTTSKGYDLPHTNATATVYMSPGYVGCPFIENIYFTTDPFDEDIFMQAANSVDISASYAHLDNRYPLYIRVNEDAHELSNTDSNTSTFAQHYDKGVYYIYVSWLTEKEPPTAQFFPTWRAQIDYTYGTDDAYTTTTSSPATTTTTKAPTTTSSGGALHLFVAAIVALVFV
ncbi:hypothetical protein PMAYCL1PPCAC_27505, partial [Pristionchus mayeri]